MPTTAAVLLEKLLNIKRAIERGDWRTVPAMLVDVEDCVDVRSGRGR